MKIEERPKVAKANWPVTCLLIALGTGILVGPLLYGWLWLCVSFGCKTIDPWFRPRDRESFVASAWHESDFDGGRRYKMANDLVARRRLSNRSHREVSVMLGTPDNEYKQDEALTIMVYGLASQQDFPASSRFFPSFWNTEAWMLEIHLKGDRVVYNGFRSG